jgi:hypothetical protein
MPATSIRDLVVKDDDLVVGTHGRSFWILDDVTPLRQVNRDVLAAPSHLFVPQVATRVRWNQNTDTPLPQEEPAGQNPPEGAILHYHLAADATGPVSLEIVDAQGKTVRMYSSADEPQPPVPGRNIPDYWIRPPQVLSPRAGLHRFTWDLRYPPPAVQQFGYPIAAVYGNTPREPRGPFVLPGEYTVRLAVAGRTLSQPLRVRMDPRVKTPPAGLQEQFDASLRVYDAIARSDAALRELRKLRAGLKDAPRSKMPPDLAAELAKLEEQAGALESGRPAEPGLARINAQLGSLLDILQDADVPPTTQARSAISDTLARTDDALGRWKSLSAQPGALNERLKSAGVPALPVR